MLCICFLQGCTACRPEPSPISVQGDALQIRQQHKEAPPPPPPPSGPTTIVITGRPTTDTTPPPSTQIPSDVPVIVAAPPKPVGVPPGTVESQELSSRLVERLKESNIPFSDKDPPKISLSEQTLEEFSKYYEARGYRLSRMTVQAMSLIKPVLAERPELAEKIDVNALDGVNIQQVVVEGTGISASDKYIDPRTYQIVNKLFVTEMPTMVPERK